jgi:hypothetical protein
VPCGTKPVITIRRYSEYYNSIFRNASDLYLRYGDRRGKVLLLIVGRRRFISMFKMYFRNKA